jgi:hypothetical protein
MTPPSTVVAPGPLDPDRIQTGPAPLAAVVTNSSAIKLPSDQQVVFSWDTLVHDTGGFWNLRENKFDLTVPVSGFYMTGMGVTWEGTASGWRQIMISIPLDEWSLVDYRDAVTPNDMQHSLSGLVYLTAGKRLHASGWQASGRKLKNLTSGRTYDGAQFSPSFWIARVG